MSSLHQQPHGISGLAFQAPSIARLDFQQYSVRTIHDLPAELEHIIFIGVCDEANKDETPLQRLATTVYIRLDDRLHGHFLHCQRPIFDC